MKHEHEMSSDTEDSPRKRLRTSDGYVSSPSPSSMTLEQVTSGGAPTNMDAMILYNPQPMKKEPVR